MRDLFARLIDRETGAAPKIKPLIPTTYEAGEPLGVSEVETEREAPPAGRSLTPLPFGEVPPPQLESIQTQSAPADPSRIDVPGMAETETSVGSERPRPPVPEVVSESPASRLNDAHEAMDEVDIAEQPVDRQILRATEIVRVWDRSPPVRSALPVLESNSPDPTGTETYPRVTRSRTSSEREIVEPAPSPEITPVEIHIGRVDVKIERSTTPPTTVRDRSPQVSLDEYLKQRNGGSK